MRSRHPLGALLGRWRRRASGPQVLLELRTRVRPRILGAIWFDDSFIIEPSGGD
jgi:hypothetical protein